MDESLQGVRTALALVNEELPAAEKRIERKIRRHTAMVLVVMVLVVSALAVTVYASQRAACRSANEVRAGLNQFVGSILQAPAAPLAPDATPAQVAARAARDQRNQAFAEEASKDFHRLTCPWP